MSVNLRDAVLESSLPADEKFLALVLIKFANPDGSSIFPSQRTIARLMSRKERAVRYCLNKLKARGVIEAVSGAGGGNTTVHYQFHAECLPTPAIDDTYPGSALPIPRQPIAALPRQPVADDPATMIQPSIKPTTQPLTNEEKKKRAEELMEWAIKAQNGRINAL